MLASRTDPERSEHTQFTHLFEHRAHVRIGLPVAFVFWNGQCRPNDHIQGSVCASYRLILKPHFPSTPAIMDTHFNPATFRGSDPRRFEDRQSRCVPIIEEPLEAAVGERVLEEGQEDLERHS